MNWLEVLNELDDAYPFLTRLGVCPGVGLPAMQMPPILRVSASIGIKMMSARDGANRAALIFPKSCDSARWIACGAAVAAMLGDFAVRYGQLPPLNPGDHLLGDGRYIAEYIGVENINDETFLKLRLGGNTKGSYLFPARQRMRLQHTSSKRRLSSRPMPKTLPDPLDGILGVSTLGNRSIYKSSVVLVSSIGESKEWGQKTLVAYASQGIVEPLIPIMNLFQWGGIDYKGDLEYWGKGQFTGKPVVAVTSDLLAVEEYMTGDCGEVRLVVIDGGTRFSRDVQLLDEILDTKLPVLAIIDSDEANDAVLLRDRGFDFWAWTREDVSDPVSGAFSLCKEDRTTGPFSSLRRVLENFRDFSINEINCSDDILERAQSALFELDKQFDPSHEQLKGIVGQLYGCILSISRSLHPLMAPIAVEWRKYTDERLKRIELELIRNRSWLAPSAFAAARVCISELFSAINSHETGEAKAKAFEDIVVRKIESGVDLLGVIVGSAEDIHPTSVYWEERLGDISRLVFSNPSTFDESLDYDALIVCGWLGSRKMLKLLHTYAAPEVYILSNQFESRWLQATQAKLRRYRVTQSSGARERLLGTKVTEAPALELPDQQAGDQPEPTDISDFELRLRFYKRQALAAYRTPDENTVQAKFIDFTDGRVAFLCESYHVPVVTNYIRGLARTEEIPQKTVTKIKPGDFLLFRESAEGNLIRTIADQGLRNSGKGHLRKVASLWREALRAYYEKLDHDMPAVIRALKDLGCRKTDFTIRQWINNDSLIAPRRYDDIKIIAAVTGDLGLKERLEEVRAAVREVRGAHLQASDFLIKKLLESVPTHLTKTRGESFSIEIEDIGRAIVVEVEEVGDEVLTVGYTRANRLLNEVWGTPGINLSTADS